MQTTKAFSILFVYVLCIIIFSNNVYGSAVAAVKQRQQQRIQAYQKAVYEQTVRQHIAEQQAMQQYAYQKAAQQHMIQSQAVAYKHALEQKAVVQQHAYQQALSQRAYQQAVVQKQVAGQVYQAAAQRNALEQEKFAYEQAIMQGARNLTPTVNRPSPMPSPMPNSMPNANEPPPSYPSSYQTVSPQPDEVVDIQDIWKQLETSSQIWLEIMDDQPKLVTVEKYVDFFKQKGVIIRKDPLYYVKLIDIIAVQNPDLFNNSFENVFQFVAIMEYDFDAGVDKDGLARQVLGEKVYLQNKKRLGYE